MNPLVPSNWKEGRRRHGRSFDRGAESTLFDASFRLAEAARDLEHAAGVSGSASATAPVLGCATSALGSQASALRWIRSLVRHELEGPITERGRADVRARAELDRSLERLAECLRLASQEADDARRLAAGIVAGVTTHLSDEPEHQSNPARPTRHARRPALGRLGTGRTRGEERTI